MPIKCPCAICGAILPSAAEIMAARRPDGTYDPATLAKWRVKSPPPEGWRESKLRSRALIVMYCMEKGIPIESLEVEP